MRGIFLIDIIPPLQGLKGIFNSFCIGRCPMLKVFCAYSAANREYTLNEQPSFKTEQPSVHRLCANIKTIKRNLFYNIGRLPVYAFQTYINALKGQLYSKTGHRPVYEPLVHISKP
jgi:hypothetical protein